LASGQSVHGVRLNGFKGLLRWPTQTNTYFSQEISDRIRVVACLTTLPNMVHSDSPGEALTSAEWQAARKALNAGDNDTLVIAWGPEADARLAAQEVILRAREATVGIPSETRQALRDGTNGFERILPGPNRMYPDTDLPPKRIMAERLHGIRAWLPPHVATREAWYREIGVPTDLVEFLSVSPLAPLFETAVKGWGLSPKLAAVVLIQYPKRLKKKLRPAPLSEGGLMEAVLRAVKDRRLYPEGVLPLLREALRTGRTVEELLLKPASEDELKKAVARAVEAVRGKKVKSKDGLGLSRFAMGLLMADWRGRAGGADLAQRLNRQITS
jgi:glutamyl-tRNA(Gln) amidotransferase subunit E